MNKGGIRVFHATTIVAVKQGEKVAIAGDGQVTFGQATVMKHTAKKVRRIYQGKVLTGFAGSVADAFTLFEKFEGKLEEYHGNLQKAAIELAKEWRTDKMLRKLEALIIVADQQKLLVISGGGEVIEPDDGIAAIGSGGNFALAAARALVTHTNLPPAEIVKEAMKVAANICVYTNENITVEEIN
jgi:ATP-dependent HslUV protease, peptidase subunit HslV